MAVDDTLGWEFPLDTPPRPKHSTPRDYQEECSYTVESPCGGYTCLHYARIEVRMGWNFGALAVFRNKKAPELLLNDLGPGWMAENTAFSPDSRYLFTTSYRIDRETEIPDNPIVIFDLEARLFSFLRLVNGMSYEVELPNDRQFRLKLTSEYLKPEIFSYLDGMTFDKEAIAWHSFEQLCDLANLYAKDELLGINP